jgi:hypothetical protein
MPGPHPAPALTGQTPHPESLARIPLVWRMLHDPWVKLSPRAIDQRWYYEGVIPGSLSGFNPFLGTVFHARRSAFARWLANPYASARDHNEGDYLVREVLFAVHDYLHVWSAAAIAALAPRVRFGAGPLLAGNLEDFVFCLLLTEAAATVGLDYWYLSVISLEERVPMGTTLSTLTVDYHERHLAEYRRFCPDWSAQRPEFLGELARFYCSGVFKGFSVADVRRSARLHSWLTHELNYGSRQRAYARLWLSFMTTEGISYERDQLSAPVSFEEEWKQRLMHDLGVVLWNKVREDHDSGLSLQALEEPPASAKQAGADFRFMNANVVSPVAGAPLSPESQRYYVLQRVAATAYDSLTNEATAQVARALRRSEHDAVLRLIEPAQPLPAEPEEPRDLFLLS